MDFMWVHPSKQSQQHRRKFAESLILIALKPWGQRNLLLSFARWNRRPSSTCSVSLSPSRAAPWLTDNTPFYLAGELSLTRCMFEVFRKEVRHCLQILFTHRTSFLLENGAFGSHVRFWKIQLPWLPVIWKALQDESMVSLDNNPFAIRVRSILLLNVFIHWFIWIFLDLL